MILDQMPKFSGLGIAGLLLKEECNKKGMYAFVSWRWIEPFAEWIDKRKCLEIMAGAGYLSWALREKGVDIIATDNMSWHKKKGWSNVTIIEELSAINAIQKYGKDVELVIMAWPYMDDDAHKALKLLSKVNPSALMVYIGEGPCGCTANEKFFNAFSEVADPRFELVAGKYETFDYMHDEMKLGKYERAHNKSYIIP